MRVFEEHKGFLLYVCYMSAICLPYIHHTSTILLPHFSTHNPLIFTISSFTISYLTKIAPFYHFFPHFTTKPHNNSCVSAWVPLRTRKSYHIYIFYMIYCDMILYIFPVCVYATGGDRQLCTQKCTFMSDSLAAYVVI